MTERILFVGVGSPNGDDQVGWRVAETLARRAWPRVEVRTACSPSELLNWLGRCDQLIVCDACRAADPPGSIFCWDWPTSKIERTTFSGSHDLPLPTVLELAAQLMRLPAHVTLLGIAIGANHPSSPLSAAVAAAVPEMVERIYRQIVGHNDCA